MDEPNFKIYNPLLQLEGISASGSLAPGAAASNINTGPAGAVNGSKISKADNLNFGVIEFDSSGDLIQTAPGSGIASLKPGAAASNINAGPPGSINSSQISGGPFLPLSGGTMLGNVNMGTNIITLSNPPVNPTDAVNKQYVDTKVASAGGFAFGGWTLSGGAFAVQVPVGPPVSAFQGAVPIGNALWPGTDGVTITMNSSGVITINNTNTIDTYYYCLFSGNGLLSSTNSDAAVYFSFFDVTNNVSITKEQSLRCVNTSTITPFGGQSFNNSPNVSAFIKVSASSSLNISVQARNPGPNLCNLSTNLVGDVCVVTVIRQA